MSKFVLQLEKLFLGMRVNLKFGRICMTFQKLAYREESWVIRISGNIFGYGPVHEKQKVVYGKDGHKRELIQISGN